MKRSIVGIIGFTALIHATQGTAWAWLPVLYLIVGLILAAREWANGGPIDAPTDPGTPAWMKDHTP